MTDHVRVLDHPAAGLLLAELRAGSTEPPAFRDAARRLGALLALEATRDLPTRDVTIDTPLGPAPAVEASRSVVAVPVLRAGLGLLPGVQDVLADVAVGMVGLERDPESLRPRRYYEKLPDLDGAWVLILEPMLATGGSAATAADIGPSAERITILSVVATGEAIRHIGEHAPRARIVTAAIDPELDHRGYIVPGLGDFGDRLWGTPHP